MTCLDEREESFRRHLDEVAPECESFGVAGCYAGAMYYKGAADAQYVPLCPVVHSLPQHYVEEQSGRTLRGGFRPRRSKSAAFDVGRAAAHWMHAGTRTFALGAVLSAGIGVLASIPLVGRIMFPRLAARLRRQAGAVFGTPKVTRLQLERTEPSPGPQCGQVGFTVEEMTDIAERVLRDIGLTHGFSRLIVTLGHGSHSMNNSARIRTRLRGLWRQSSKRAQTGVRYRADPQ